MKNIDGHPRTAIHVSLLAALAVAFRTGLWAATSRITFDEGVFLASNDLTASGLTPFQDFFSSQGPLFLPLLRFGQILSFGDYRGPRTTLVVASVFITVSLYFILLRTTSPPRALLLSSLAAVSGTVLLAAGPVQSDGLALGLAMAGLAVLLSVRKGTYRDVAVGLLIGAAVAVKSLHVIPIIVVVVACFVWKRNWRGLTTTTGTSMAVVILTSLPYGLGLVFDQYVLFHMAKDNSPSIWANFADAGEFFLKFDLPLTVALILSGILAIVPSTQKRQHHSDLPIWIPLLWLVATVVLLFGFTPIDSGFIRTLAFLVPPLILVISTYENFPIRLLLGLAVLGAIFQFATIDVAPGPNAEEQAAVEAVASIPEQYWFVSDDPGLGWSARRLSHPDTVDPSYARFNTDYLTAADVEESLKDPNTCVFLSTSGRFDAAGVVTAPDYLPTNVPGVNRRSPGC